MDRRSLLKGVAGAIIAGPAVAEAVVAKEIPIASVKPIEEAAVTCMPYLYDLNTDSMRCLHCGEVVTGIQYAQDRHRCA